jgi:flagellar FliJ protein
VTKRSERLSPILDLTENREKKSAEALGQSRKKLESARKGLDNLLQFRGNYAARFEKAANEGLGIRQVQEYRAFLEKINVAIADQERAVRKAERDENLQRAHWEADRQRMQGMRKVVDHSRTLEYAQEQKREQAEMDDRASRRAERGAALSAS